MIALPASHASRSCSLEPATTVDEWGTARPSASATIAMLLPV